MFNNFISHLAGLQFLKSIVPYNPPESHVWKTDTLQQLTTRELFWIKKKRDQLSILCPCPGVGVCMCGWCVCIQHVALFFAVLEAIADDSTEVPQLLSDYLQSEGKFIVVAMMASNGFHFHKTP